MGLEALEQPVAPVLVDRHLVGDPHPLGSLVGLHVEDLLVERGGVVDHDQDLGLGIEIRPRLQQQLLDLVEILFAASAIDPILSNHPLVLAWLTDQSIGGDRPRRWPRKRLIAPDEKESRPVVDFTLTDEQKDLRELAHNFAEKEIRKVAWEYDKDGTWPQDIIDKAWEVGLMNTHIPEAYGGPGLDYLSGCLIEEEMGWGCSGIGTSLMANGLASAPITLGGSEETKKKYLGMLAEEPKLASFCLTEPDAGSDVSGMKTRAVKKGDKYVINGSKCFITNGTYADYFTVYAKTDPEAGHRGISAFVVDADLPGVSVDKKEDKMGQRASNTATISFDEVEIPAENLHRRGEQGLQAGDDDPRPHPARASRRWPSASAAPPSSTRPSTPRKGSSSACRSRCTRRSSS